jgi:hypothetical protein
VLAPSATFASSAVAASRDEAPPSSFADVSVQENA